MTLNPVLAAGVEAYDAGGTLLPAARDGLKRPQSLPVPPDCADPKCVAKWAQARQAGIPAKGWAHWTHARPTREQTERWLRSAHGLCLLTGSPSAGVVLLETDTPEMAERLRAELGRSGWGDVIDRMDAGYLEQSPSGGTHWLVRVPGWEGRNTKLASRPGEGHERQVLVETREEGGQVVVAPSAGRTHPSGRPYVLLAGGFVTIPTLSVAEWEGVRAGAARCDEMPAPVVRAKRHTSAREWKDQPFDLAAVAKEFNRRTTWEELLAPAGWTVHHQLGENTYWRRPGEKKDPGHSASTNDDVFWCWSTSTVFESERGYSRFGVFAVLRHGGDHLRAAATLDAWWKRQAS